jgi:protein tyrosine/serine phosphatase
MVRMESDKRGKKRLKGRYLVLVVVGSLLMVASVAMNHCGCGSGFTLGLRNYGRNKNSANVERWAQQMDLAGVPNFHKVSDGLYRGAQPTAKGMQALEEFGIKTVVNLRSEHSDSKAIEKTKLDYEEIGFNVLREEDADVVGFLKIIADANRAPVFVHCHLGSDRTGMMSAIYRIVIEDWSKDDAIEEMTQGGYGFYSGLNNIVDYVRKLDVEEVKNASGLND